MKRCAVLFVAILGCAAALAETPAKPVWLKGDLHVHDDHSSDGSLPRQRAKDRAKGNNSVGDQISQGERQHLDFMPLTDHRTYDQQYDPLWESSALLLIPGEEANGSPHANVLGGVNSIVQGAARPGAAIAHIQQSIWNAHSQDAAWSVNHPDDGDTNEDGTPNERANVQGVDLVEIWNKASNTDKEIAYSENRWTAGFRFGVAGASDSHFREYWDRQGPGFPTTSVLAIGRTERGIVDAIRAGHISISFNPGGPFLDITAQFGAKGFVAGDEAVLPANAKGRLHIRAEHAKGMQVLIYRQPGRSAGPVRTFTPASDDETFTLDIATSDKPDWYRAEIRGLAAAVPPAPPAMELKAIASPIFLSSSPVAARPEVAIPPDQGADDGAELFIGKDGAFSGFPDIAIANGIVHVVAETHGNSQSRIDYRRTPAAGSRRLTMLPTPVEARFPRIAARGQDVWIVWQSDQSQVPHRPEILLRHSADGGATWDLGKTIRSLPGRAEHPDIAITADGHPFIVWQEIRAGEPFDIMALEVGVDAAPRNLSREGKTFHPADADDTRSARYPASVLPAVAVAPNGAISVAWQDNRTDIDPLWTGSATAPGTNPDDWQINVATRSPTGAWSKPASLGAADAADRHPDIAYAANNLLAVIWETKGLSPAGKNLSLLAATSADGLTFAAPEPVAPDANAMSERPRLSATPDGRIHAVWQDTRSADWRWRIMTATRDASGWSKGDLINSKGNNFWPAISGDTIAFASTRNAARLQRDRTQQIYILESVGR